MKECHTNLIKRIVINIGLATCPRSAVLASPRANTANLGPVTGPIRNYLINNTVVQPPVCTLISHELGPVLKLDWYEFQDGGE